MAVSPLLLGLIATAGLLAAIVCLVLAALYRRQYSRPCPRPEGRTKHVPLEAVLASDDHLATQDGGIISVASVRPMPQSVILTGVDRSPVITEDTDPDIIRNQYGKFTNILLIFIFLMVCTWFFTERRQVHGFMKLYEPGMKPGEEEEEAEEQVDEYDFRHVAKDSHIPNHNVSF